MRFFIFVFSLVISTGLFAAHEATAFGKVTGIESRTWGMHIQTTFPGGASNDCAVNVGDQYMFDLRFENEKVGSSYNDEVSMIMSAFAAQSDIAFHIYGCNGSRPDIGYIRLRR